MIVNPGDTTEDKSIKHNSWLSITKRSLVLLLIERITAIAEIIGVEGVNNLKEISSSGVDDSQELKQCQERLVAICKKLMVEKVKRIFDIVMCRNSSNILLEGLEKLLCSVSFSKKCPCLFLQYLV